MCLIVCIRELILRDSKPKAILPSFSFYIYRTYCPIYLQALLLKVSGFCSILHGRIGLMWFISSAGVGGRNFDRFALFHFCRQLKKYILWLLWQAFIAPGLKRFRGAVTSKCCFHNSKTKYSSFSFFFCCYFAVQRGTKFSKLISVNSFSEETWRDSLALKRNQQKCLSDDIPAVSHTFAEFCSKW